MIFDETTLLETNDVMRELFHSLNNEEKNLLLKRVLNVDEEQSPLEMMKWTLQDWGMINRYIKETPARRKSLKKFSPDKIDLHMLVYKSYFFLENCLCIMLELHERTMTAKHPMDKVFHFGRSFFFLRTSQSQKLLKLTDPLTFFAGTFFYEDYPYDDQVFSVCS
jgi:hypothetical protein